VLVALVLVLLAAFFRMIREEDMVISPSRPRHLLLIKEEAVVGVAVVVGEAEGVLEAVTEEEVEGTEGGLEIAIAAVARMIEVAIEEDLEIAEEAITAEEEVIEEDSEIVRTVHRIVVEEGAAASGIVKTVPLL
jgi:hypothetical protein